MKLLSASVLDKGTPPLQFQTYGDRPCLEIPRCRACDRNAPLSAPIAHPLFSKPSKRAVCCPKTQLFNIWTPSHDLPLAPIASLADTYLSG